MKSSIQKPVKKCLCFVQFENGPRAKCFLFSNMIVQIEWTFANHGHEFCVRVMPFPQTRPEVCCSHSRTTCVDLLAGFHLGSNDMKIFL